MDDCRPCKDVDGYLQDLAKEYDFEIEAYNITSQDYKERKKGKQTLAKYGTIKVPLLVFSVDGEDKASVYREHIIDNNIEQYQEMSSDILKKLATDVDAN